MSAAIDVFWEVIYNIQSTHVNFPPFISTVSSQYFTSGAISLDRISTENFTSLF